MAALRERQGVSARALEFLILTAARTGEVIGEMVGKSTESRSFGRSPPLGCRLGRSIAFQSLRKPRRNDFVFIGPRNAGLSNMSMLTGPSQDGHRAPPRLRTVPVGTVGHGSYTADEPPLGLPGQVLGEVLHPANCPFRLLEADRPRDPMCPYIYNLQEQLWTR